MSRYARRSRSVLEGGNAAPYVRSRPRRRSQRVDWDRLIPGARPVESGVIAISLVVVEATEPGTGVGAAIV